MKPCLQPALHRCSKLMWNLRPPGRAQHHSVHPGESWERSPARACLQTSLLLLLIVTVVIFILILLLLFFTLFWPSGESRNVVPSGPLTTCAEAHPIPSHPKPRTQRPAPPFRPWHDVIPSSIKILCSVILPAASESLTGMRAHASSCAAVN
jgi:hypothetical protein